MADARTDPQYKLRLPADLKARIEAEAQANNRSMNAEIISRLEESFSGRVEYAKSLEEYIHENTNSLREALFKTLSIVEQDRHERILRDKIIHDSLAALKSPIPKTNEEAVDQNKKLRAGMKALEDQKAADAARNKNIAQALEHPDDSSSPSLKKLTEIEKKLGLD